MPSVWSQNASSPKPLVGLGARAQLEPQRQVEQAVDVEGEVQAGGDLLGDLVLAAEDVGVVLAEVPDAHQAVQRAARLAAVQQAGLGAAEGQVACSSSAAGRTGGRGPGSSSA